MKPNLSSRVRRRRALSLVAALLALAAGGGSLGAEVEADARPLELRLSINVVTPDGHVFMKLDQMQPTVAGRGVGVKLEQADQLRIEALFTPVFRTSTEMTLHAQGQIWVGDPDGGYGETPVASTYRAMPVALGDTVLFFPLGGERALRGSTERFHFQSGVLPVDPPASDEADDGPVTVLIVMAVQVVLQDRDEVPQDRDGAAGRRNVVS